MHKIKGQGGPGRGQGRRPVQHGERTVTVSLRMTERQRERLREMGGAGWVRDRIDAGEDASVEIERMACESAKWKALADANAKGWEACQKRHERKDKMIFEDAFKQEALAFFDRRAELEITLGAIWVPCDDDEIIRLVFADRSRACEIAGPYGLRLSNGRSVRFYVRKSCCP